MGFSSIWHWLIVLVIVLLVFGAGKLPKVAGDLAKGIKNFKAGLKDEEDSAAAGTPDAAKVLPAAAPPVAAGPAAPAGAPTLEGTVIRKDETPRA